MFVTVMALQGSAGTPSKVQACDETAAKLRFERVQGRSMIDQRWIQGRIEGLERGMADLKTAIASLESSVRMERSVSEKHDGLVRRLSESVATVNITLTAVERGLNGIPIKVAEQARDIERLNARMESLAGELKQTTAAEIAGRYSTSKAVIAAIGSIIGALCVWLLRG